MPSWNIEQREIIYINDKGRPGFINIRVCKPPKVKSSNVSVRLLVLILRLPLPSVSSTNEPLGYANSTQTSNDPCNLNTKVQANYQPFSMNS